MSHMRPMCNVTRSLVYAAHSDLYSLSSFTEDANNKAIIIIILARVMNVSFLHNNYDYKLDDE